MFGSFWHISLQDAIKEQVPSHRTARRGENIQYCLPCAISNPFATLLLQIPHSLFKESGYDHREALFGVPPYGGSIAQNVYYADSDLCEPNVDTRGGYPQRDNDSSGKMAPWPSPYILMVDRGGCTFVKKVGRVIHAFLLSRFILKLSLYSLLCNLFLGSKCSTIWCRWSHHRRHYMPVL